jgi:hypothetical protein
MHYIEHHQFGILTPEVVRVNDEVFASDEMFASNEVAKALSVDYAYLRHYYGQSTLKRD